MKRKAFSLAAAASSFATSALADPMTNGSPYYGYGHMWDGGYGFIGLGMMILFWGAIILLVVWAIRALSDGGSRKGRSSSALEILQERLARGEIDTEEYQARKKALED